MMKLVRLFGRLTLWKLVLGLLLIAGAYAAAVRFTQGLGAATNLSDAYPWGLWIGFDVLVGVGVAAGGFVIAATVHVFHMERYAAIARPALLTAFLGYLMVILAVLFDLGRPTRIWHPLVFWNPRSVMFLIGWCEMLYAIVLALEFSPLLFEKLGWTRPLRAVRKLMGPLVILGVILSVTHQSSLGSLYVIAPDKLHPLWYSGMLPVLFLVSAVAAGLAMTMFESCMSSRAFGRRLEGDLLRGLARAVVVVQAVYLVLRANDLLYRGALHYAFEATPEAVLFWGEIGLGSALPMVLLASRRVRYSNSGLFFAATLTVMGFIVHRLNVAVTGMAGWTGASYFPSVLEMTVTVSLVALGVALFGLAGRWLPVFPPAREERVPAWMIRRRPAAGGPFLTRPALFGLWVMVAVGAVGVAATGGLPALGGGRDAAEVAVAAAGGEESPRPVSADGELTLPPPWLFPAGEESPGPVRFDHRDHVDAGELGCRRCHPGLFLFTRSGAPAEGEIDADRAHDGDLCAACHDGETAFNTYDDCTLCHVDSDD
ncbi:MAG: Ni/Fe-hydrogenase cytochrome b subunit [Planctomycetota bacterium]|nr:MAG: Ni/Fe-hydrogenase cytochrome b subunit [Planctomycetota bacterium]